ncbi:MAG: hypothetical protein KBG47_10370 [Bacteroidia bacterium]|nr:hypothetical protein [Bacteroidia bacterium]
MEILASFLKHVFYWSYLGVPPRSRKTGHTLEVFLLLGVGLSPLALFYLVLQKIYSRDKKGAQTMAQSLTRDSKKRQLTLITGMLRERLKRKALLSTLQNVCWARRQKSSGLLSELVR